jgi:hypothetical protein
MATKKIRQLIYFPLLFFVGVGSESGINILILQHCCYQTSFILTNDNDK